MYGAHLYVCHSAPPLAPSAKNKGPSTYLDQVVSAAKNGALRGLESKASTVSGGIASYSSARSTTTGFAAFSGSSARRWEALTERFGFTRAIDESALEFADSGAVDAARISPEPRPTSQLLPSVSVSRGTAGECARKAASASGCSEGPRLHLLPARWTRAFPVHGTELGAAAETTAAHHPYEDGKACTVSESARGAVSSSDVPMPARGEVVSSPQQSLLIPSPPAMMSTPRSVPTASSFASVQQILIEYEALFRRDLTIDFYVTYPTRLAACSAPSPPLRQLELDASSASSTSPTRKRPPAIIPSRSTSMPRSQRVWKKTKTGAKRRNASAGEWRRFRIVFPGALWPCVLRHHRQLLARALRRDVEASLPPGETVKVISLYAAEAEIEIILGVMESPTSQSRISAVLSCSSFAEAWEVYKVVAVSLSRGFPQTSPPQVLSPPPSYEHAISASTAMTPAAAGNAATAVQTAIIPPLPLPPVPNQSKADTTSFTKASLSNVGPAAAALTMHRPLNLRVPLLFPLEGTDELQRLIDTAPSPLRLALHRDAMYAVPDAEVEVYSWAVNPAGLYVDLFLRCVDSSDAHVAFNAEAAMDRCPFTETWDVIRAHTTGLASATVTVPVVVKRCASMTPAPQRMDKSLTTTTPTVSKTTTSTAKSKSFARSTSPRVERVQSSWLLPAVAVLNASDYANSERDCGSTTHTVYSFIADKSVNSCTKPPPMRANTGTDSASSMVATSRPTPAPVSPKGRVTNTTTTSAPNIAPKMTSRQMIELPRMSVPKEIDSLHSFLSSESSRLNISSVDVPCADLVSAQALLHPPLLRSAKEDAALMIDMPDGQAQGFTESTEHSSKLLALRTMTIKSTSAYPVAHAAKSTETMSDGKTADKTLLSPPSFRPLRPIPSQWSDHTATVEQEQLASHLLFDAQLPSGQKPCPNTARRTLTGVSSAASVATVHSLKDDAKGISPVKRARAPAVVQVERKASESDSLGDGMKGKRGSVQMTEKPTMSSLHLTQVALPGSKDLQDQAAAVGQEMLASRMPHDAGERRSKSRREQTNMRATLDRGEWVTAREPHEPIVMSSCATAVKKTLEPPPVTKSVTPLLEVPAGRLSTDNQECAYLEVNGHGMFVDSEATEKGLKCTPSPAEDSAMAAELMVQKVNLESTEGRRVASKTGRIWGALQAQCPKLKEPALEADAQPSFGLLTAAIEKVIVGCGEEPGSEVVGSPDVPLQPPCHESKAEAIPTAFTASSVFSKDIIEASRLMPQRRTLTSKSILDASAKSVHISQLELFSSSSASAASTPASRAKTPQVQLPSNQRDRLPADHYDDVAKASMANDEPQLSSVKAEIQTTSVPEDSSLQVDLSVPKDDLPYGFNPPDPQRSLSLRSPQPHDAAAADAPLRVHLRRTFPAPGLCKEKLTGKLEEVRSLFLVETCTVLDAPQDFVEELQLSGNLTVDVTLHMPNSHVEKEWRSVLMGYDYPQLNELLHEVAGAPTPQVSHQIEVKLNPEGASQQNLLYNTKLVSPPEDTDGTSHAVYVKGDLWPEVIRIQADVLHEVLISDATAALGASEFRVHRVRMVSYANGALFTFFLQNLGASSLRVAQDVLEQCPFTAAWELYRRFRGAPHHSIIHQVTDTTCLLQLGGKAWAQVLKEHGGLLAETFVCEVLLCLRGSDDAAVTVSVSVTDVVAKSDGLTIAYDITSAADGTDVDRRRVADAVKEYPFPQLWKMYDTFMLAQDPFKYTKNAHWMTSRRLSNLSNAYNVPEQMMKRQYSHIGFELETSLRHLQAHKEIVGQPDETGKAALLSLGSTPEMKAQDKYELKLLPAPAAVLEISGSLVPPETAAVPIAQASLVDFAEATEKACPAAVAPNVRGASAETKRTKAEARTADSPTQLPSPQRSSLEQCQPPEVEEEQQLLRRRHHHHHRNARAEHGRHNRQLRVREQSTNACEQRTLRYASSVSSAETESDGFEHALAPSPTTPRGSSDGKVAIRVLSSPVASKASAITSTPTSRSLLTAVHKKAAPVELCAPSPVQPLTFFHHTPQSPESPPVHSPSHLISSAPVDEAKLLHRQYVDPRLERHLFPQEAHRHLTLSRLPVPNVHSKAPITLLDVRMAHPFIAAAPDATLPGSAMPTVIHPQYSAHNHLGIPRLPSELPQICQMNKVAAYPFTAPSLHCSGQTSSYHSPSPPLLAPASSSSDCGSAASVPSNVTGNFSALPLQGTRIRPCYPSSFVVISTEPSGVLQKLWDDVDSLEEIMRTRYPRMKRDLMIPTATATLPSP